MKLNMHFIIISLLISTNLLSQTYVSGGIYSNTTWDLTSSPYIVTDDIVIFGDVTLTIEPGVTINFYDEKKLEVRGILSAMGNLNDTITFTSISSSPTQSIWVGLSPQVNSSITLKFCEILYATRAIDWNNAHYSSHTVQNSRFANNYYGFYFNPGSTINLSNCLFENNYKGIFSYWDKTINYCTFINNGYGVDEVDDCEIQNCDFTGNTEIGLKGWRGEISNCSMTDNNIGISFSMQGNPIISNNNISNNLIGFRITGNVPTAEISNNYICNNTEFNIKNTIPDNVNFANNCWCLNDTDSIKATIYDGYNDVTVGLVNYMPFKNDCNNTGINSGLLDISKIKVFPNPTSNTINLELGNKSNIMIFDFTGKKIYQMNSTSSNSKINVSNFLSGIYLVKIENSNYTVTKRIIINR